jgi:anti-sigma B factor antagonist
MLLEIKEETISTAVVLRLKGRLTLGREIQRLEDHVAKLKATESLHLIFDMAAVDFVDSAGLGMLTQCFGNVTNSGGKFYLAGITDRVKEVLKFTRLDTILPIVGTVDDALGQ